MHRKIFYLVNFISLYRLVMSGVLVFLVLTGNFGIFRYLIAVSFATDALDGWLARRYSISSFAGARLDSLADDLTTGVAIFAVIVFFPGFFITEWVYIIPLGIVYLIQLITAFWKYGHASTFHTHASKFSAVLQGVFFLLLFFVPGIYTPLFRFTCIITGLALLEEIFLVQLVPKDRSDIRSLIWFFREKRITRI